MTASDPRTTQVTRREKHPFSYLERERGRSGEKIGPVSGDNAGDSPGIGACSTATSPTPALPDGFEASA